MRKFWFVFGVFLLSVGCIGTAGRGGGQVIQEEEKAIEEVQNYTDQIAQGVTRVLTTPDRAFEVARAVNLMNFGGQQIITGRSPTLSGKVLSKKQQSSLSCSCEFGVCSVRYETYVRYVTSRVISLKIDLLTGDAFGFDGFFSDMGVTGYVVSGYCNFTSCEFFNPQQNCTLDVVGSFDTMGMCVDFESFGVSMSKGKNTFVFSSFWDSSVTQVVCTLSQNNISSCDIYIGNCEQISCVPEPSLSCDFSLVSSCAGFTECIASLGRFTSHFGLGVDGFVCGDMKRFVVENGIDGVKEYKVLEDEVMVRECTSAVLNIQKCEVQECLGERTTSYRIRRFFTTVTSRVMQFEFEEDGWMVDVTATLTPVKNIFRGMLKGEFIELGFSGVQERGIGMMDFSGKTRDGREISGRIHMRDGRFFGDMRFEDRQFILRSEEETFSLCESVGENVRCKRYRGMMMGRR